MDLICAGGFICGADHLPSSSDVVSYHNNHLPIRVLIMIFITNIGSIIMIKSPNHSLFLYIVTISTRNSKIIMSKLRSSIYQIPAIIGHSWPPSLLPGCRAKKSLIGSNAMQCNAMPNVELLSALFREQKIVMQNCNL